MKIADILFVCKDDPFIAEEHQPEKEIFIVRIPIQKGLLLT